MKGSKSQNIVSFLGFVDLTVAWTCENLRELDVSHNRLKEIPIHIQSTSRLAKLDVSYNRLIQFPAPWPCEMVSFKYVI